MRTTLLVKSTRSRFHISILTGALLLLVGGNLITTKGMGQSSSLIGTWRVDIDQTIGNMDPSGKIRYDTLPMAFKERSASRMNGREFIFSQNGEITVNWKSHKGQEISNGQWIKSDAERELSITIDNNTSAYDFEFLTSNVLVMRGKNKRGFFDNLYLVKVN